MMRKKTCAMICMIFLLLPLASSLIQPAKASSDHWDEYWHGGIYENYPGSPENVSTTITVYNNQQSQWVKIALVVSVYQYEPYVDDDVVVLRVALYYDSFAKEDVLPVPADSVTIFVQKDTEGSNLNDQAMEVRYSDIRPGFAQGSGLDQNDWVDSTQDDRECWALDALDFAAGLFCEPLSVATGMISFASAWIPQEGVDYDNADWSETWLYSWWENPGYDFGYENPVRQYTFNTIEWVQHGVNPSTYYGIKVWARVTLTQSSIVSPPFIDTSPVYLRIHGSHTLSISTTSGGTTNPTPGAYTYESGSSVTVTAQGYSHYIFDYWILDGATKYGNEITVTMDSDHDLTAYFEYIGYVGGCPTLFVWNGTDYVDYGVIDIHNPTGEDVIREVAVLVEDVGISSHRATFRLREGWPELSFSESVIDQVKLYAINEDGKLKLCPLLSATHSRLGDVREYVVSSDDVKVQTLLLETIDLTFKVREDFQGFVFVIEGCNLSKV